jgi:hypothetical protein
VITAVVAAAGPRPLRQVARAGVAAYAAALAATTIDAARHGSVRDTAGLLVVLPVMHASWGLGFLYGVAHYGVAAEAVSALARPAREA